ncbi:hypothetical protein NPIL_541711 [Nephila pilipes]|uniref:Uncharacterized protein n=1 Tax=Nephila pilipes TaxID=299642 RepID=A0A8X6PJ38_NEPPI|nr:hypothetical protein NPIL_541711 [Nephila pilipes]
MERIGYAATIVFCYGRQALLSSSLMSPDECNVKTSWVCVCKERECWSQVYFRVEYAPPTKVTRDVETSLFGRIQENHSTIGQSPPSSGVL